MSRRCVGLVVVVLLCGVRGFAQAQPQAAATSAPAIAAGPRIELSPAEFDFGELWQGMPAEREFTVKNAGDAPLTISSRSNCGCTVATPPKSPLEPGESCTFKIRYDTCLLYTSPSPRDS